MNLTRLSQPIFFMGIILSGFWYLGDALTGLLLLAAVVLTTQAVFKRQFVETRSMSVMMLLYLIWLFVVAFTSASPQESMMGLAVLAGLPVMYLVASNTDSYQKIWETLRIPLFIMAVVLAVWAIWQVVFHLGRLGFAEGPLDDRNAFAATMNLLWFPTVYLFLSSKATSSVGARVVVGMGLFIVTLALFATASRGGIATWFLLLPVILWASYQYTKSKQKVALILLIAILAYLCSSLLLHSDIAGRTFKLASDESTSARLLLWKSTLSMAIDHPLVGTGWGTFRSYYPAYRSPLEGGTAGIFAHNDYLQFASEGGFLAMLLLLSLLILIGFQLKRSLKNASQEANFESITLLLGVLAILIHAAVNFIFHLAYINILVGLYLAKTAQLTDISSAKKLPSFEHIRPSVRYLLLGFVTLFIAAPFAIRLVSAVCIVGPQFGTRLIKVIAPNVSAFNIASLITVVHPQESIAQEYMLQTYEHSLASSTSNANNIGTLSDKRELLNEAVKYFNSVRKYHANDATVGYREAKLMIENKDALESDVAYRQAYEILKQSLVADPYHTDASIMLARLEFAMGHRADALATLKSTKSLQHFNQQLVTIESLRILAAPKVFAELDEIEQQIKARSSFDKNQKLALPANINEIYDKKINAVATKIKQDQ